MARYPPTGFRKGWAACASRPGPVFARLVPESGDQALEFAGEFGEVLGGSAGVARALPGFGRGVGHLADAVGDLGGAGGRLPDVAADRVGGRRLLLDRRGDRGLDLVDLVDDRADVVDRRHRA